MGRHALGTIGIVWYQNEQNRVIFYLMPQKLWVANFAGWGPLILVLTILKSPGHGDFRMVSQYLVEFIFLNQSIGHMWSVLLWLRLLQNTPTQQ